MCCIITKTPEIYTNKIYGKTYVDDLGDGRFLVTTNWRRLPTFKITHLKDIYYSVLSTTMNSMMSCNNDLSVNIPGKYQRIFAIRTLFSVCTNQRIAEILMDNRYAYMSAFATHTNINKLLIEKFGPSYSCVLEVWVIKRIFEKLKMVYLAATSNNIQIKRPEVILGKMQRETIGGDICIPSIWTNYELRDIQELLDEAFIYVLTIKEPSNIFHEQINAVKTIIEFQDQFDNLPKKFQTGNIYTEKDIREYLLWDTKIGFCAGLIKKSVTHTIEMEKPNYKKIIHDIADEPLSEIISTKAVIADLEREVVQDQEPTKRMIAKKISKIQEYTGRDITIVEKNELSNYYLKTNSTYYGERKPRQKVIETVLDYIEKDDKLENTTDLAEYFIQVEKGKMIADICIKAQYGSKREFYVINIGAKALARCTENFFKKISENSPNEAISIAGDKKILEMQRMLDTIFSHNKLSENTKLKFVNGDCTKWSAAETLGSFISLIQALRPKITDNMYQLLLATFNVWSDKYIQIPMDIYNKVVPPTDKKYKNLIERLKFMDTKLFKNKSMVHSTQNFLQGMFNYASSYKAVCCTNYTYRIWKKIYPDSPLVIEHMEHSDDYVLIVLYEDEDEFEKFRVLQKIMMRLHGYNDSDRKTNCQSFFMEFVSQLSFNGVMLYPQIKKK